ncbi:MAG: hypothetical protein ABI818_09780 [Acidobacteriota bacterium]
MLGWRHVRPTPMDWGYAIGGPVGKPGGTNKLFFFYAQEYRPRNGGGTIRRFRVPTALERAGDFSQTLDNNGALLNLIRDASTGLPCTVANTSGCFQDGGVVGRIPQSRLYQTGLNILKMWPIEANVVQARRRLHDLVLANGPLALRAITDHCSLISNP